MNLSPFFGQRYGIYGSPKAMDTVLKELHQQAKEKQQKDPSFKLLEDLSFRYCAQESFLSGFYEMDTFSNTLGVGKLLKKQWTLEHVSQEESGWVIYTGKDADALEKARSLAELYRKEVLFHEESFKKWVGSPYASLTHIVGYTQNFPAKPCELERFEQQAPPLEKYHKAESVLLALQNKTFDIDRGLERTTNPDSVPPKKQGCFTALHGLITDVSRVIGELPKEMAQAIKGLYNDLKAPWKLFG